MHLKSVVGAATVLGFAVFSPSQSPASTIINQNISGLVAPTVIDFGANLFPDGTPAGSLFPGVTFSSNFSYFTCAVCNFPDVAGGFLNSDSLINFDIKFTSDVTGAAFSWRTSPNNTSTFEALLNGSVVETFAAPTDDNLVTGSFYGFTGILFDEIKISTLNNGATLDNLEFNPTPLPAALPLFATGLGALGLLGWRRKKKAAALA